MNVMRIETINDFELGAKLSEDMTEEIVNNVMASELNDDEIRVAALRASNTEREIESDLRSGEGETQDLGQCFGIADEYGNDDLSEDEGSLSSGKTMIVTPKILDPRALSKVCQLSPGGNQSITDDLAQDYQPSILERILEKVKMRNCDPEEILREAKLRQLEEEAKAVQDAADKFDQQLVQEHQMRVEKARAEGATKSIDDDPFTIQGRYVTNQVTNETLSRLDVTDLVQTTKSIGEEYVVKKIDGAFVLYIRQVKESLFAVGDAVHYDTDNLTGSGRIKTIESRVTVVDGREFRVPVYDVKLAPGLVVTAHPSELGWNPKARPAMMTPLKSSA